MFVFMHINFVYEELFFSLFMLVIYLQIRNTRGNILGRGSQSTRSYEYISNEPELCLQLKLLWYHDI